MKCKIIFDDWRQIGKVGSIYSEATGIELSLGDLHSGTTFDAEIYLPVDKNIEKEIEEALKNHGAYPVFSIIVEKQEKEN